MGELLKAADINAISGAEIAELAGGVNGFAIETQFVIQNGSITRLCSEIADRLARIHALPDNSINSA